MRVAAKIKRNSKWTMLCFWLMAVLTIIYFLPVIAQRRPSPKVVVLAHVTVVDLSSGQLRQNQFIVIEGERIVAVGGSDAVVVPSGARVINALGKYVIPGLWDAHVHLSYLGACALPVFVANGVTSVRDCGARLEDTSTWQEQIAHGKLIGPRIKTSGPNLESSEWLARAWKILPSTDVAWRLGPRQEVRDTEQAAVVVESLARLGVDFIKFRNLPREKFMAVMTEAKRRGLIVAGHAPKGTSLAEASDAGMRSIEHAETIMLSLGSLPAEERLRSFQVLARNGTLITPTLITDVAAHLTPDSDALGIIADTHNARDVRRRYISAQTLRLWQHGIELKKQYEDSEDWHSQYRREVQDMRLARRAGVQMMTGTDVGGTFGLYPGFSLHDELELLVKEVGLTPVEALQSATLDPPAFFSLQMEFGAIEPGKIADLVLLDANPLTDIRNTRRIRAVVIRGKVFERPALDAMLAEVASAVSRGTGCEAEKQAR
jgi:imidazolonepropionase-like amidohydrolase